MIGVNKLKASDKLCFVNFIFKNGCTDSVAVAETPKNLWKEFESELFRDGKVHRKDKDNALKVVKLLAKQHNCTLKAELDLLDFDASILSSEYRLPIATMIKELRKYEA